MKKKIFSGMRPTGKLHLGHLVGALHNWVRLQEEYDCIFGLVDWHALMGEYEQSESIRRNMIDNAIDWIACGIDPERSTIAVQSQVPEHLELFMIFSCLTPLGWLERNPTYKEQMREITTRDLHTYGFLGYPVLQAADIMLYKAEAVPIGEDQLPHIELTREIARRFNHIFRTKYFSDCEAILTPVPRLLGLDNRKMSKSYQNTINLSDDARTVTEKVRTMFTDPARIKLSDPGHPDVCNVYSYYKVFAPQKAEDVWNWCAGARKGCTECKTILADHINSTLEPIRARRREIEKRPGRIEEIIREGTAKARGIAQKTMGEIRSIIFG